MKHGTLYFSARYTAVMLLFSAVLVTLGFFVRVTPTRGETVGPPAVPADAAIASAPLTVVIDAGHGGEDCGAIGISGVYEKDLNLQLSAILADCFRAAGCRVLETRTDDRLLYTEEQNIRGQRKAYDLRNRLLVADGAENALLVSIHMNSYPEEKVKGLQVWYAPQDELSLSVAEAVQRAAAEYLQPDNRRRAKEAGSDMYLLANAGCPAVLIECGFLSNEEECGALESESYQKQLCFVIFCAIMEAIKKTGNG